MIPINNDFQLECNECGCHEFTITLSDKYTSVACIDCETIVYYQENTPIIQTDRKDYVPASLEYLDEIPW